jgi:hypothetical protein
MTESGSTEIVYSHVIKEIERRGPAARVLIFGLGNNSKFYEKAIHPEARIVFLEDNKKRFAETEVRHEKYLVSWFMEDPAGNPASSAPHFCELPREVEPSAFNIISVDAPDREHPGRTGPIRMARELIDAGGVVFIHDSQRTVEKLSILQYFDSLDWYSKTINDTPPLTILTHKNSIWDHKADTISRTGSRPLVSVIMTAYNKSVNVAIDRLLDVYPYPDLEFIVIDDGSDMPVKYTGKYDRVIVKRTENRGQGAAANLGEELAGGNFIFHLEPDFYATRGPGIPKDLIERCICALQSNNQVDYIRFFEGFGRPSLGETIQDAGLLLRRLTGKVSVFSFRPHIRKKSFLQKTGLFPLENETCERWMMARVNDLAESNKVGLYLARFPVDPFPHDWLLPNSWGREIPWEFLNKYS